MTLTVQPAHETDTADWWMPEVLDAWATGRPVPANVIAVARLYGIPKRRPDDPHTAFRLLWAAGATPEEAAEACGLTVDEGLHAIRRLPDWIPDMVRLHVEGSTASEIARQLDVGRTLVIWHLRRLGLDPVVKTKPLTERRKREIVRAWEAGESMASIARRFGVSYDQVRYAVGRKKGGRQ